MADRMMVGGYNPQMYYGSFSNAYANPYTSAFTGYADYARQAAPSSLTPRFANAFQFNQPSDISTITSLYGNGTMQGANAGGVSPAFGNALAGIQAAASLYSAFEGAKANRGQLKEQRRINDAMLEEAAFRRGRRNELQSNYNSIYGR